MYTILLSRSNAGPLIFQQRTESDADDPDVVTPAGGESSFAPWPDPTHRATGNRRDWNPWSLSQRRHTEWKNLLMTGVPVIPIKGAMSALGMSRLGVGTASDPAGMRLVCQS